MTRPVKGDYSPYYEAYISKVEGENGIVILKSQLSSAIKYFDEIPEDKGTYSYAVGKWSIKELIGHIIDTERVFAYRAMCFARGEIKSLPGFEQDDYVKAANFNKKKLSDLTNEFKLLREANIAMFKNFDEAVFNYRGLANEKEITVLSILFIISGHAIHHINILKERYLK
ncbi:MAG: DinB family protein [Ignavibacteriaceae bacterium]